MTEPRESAALEAAARREGVRLGVRDALSREVDRTSTETLLLIVAAGGLGLAAAVVAVELFARGAPGIDPLHLAVCAAAWSSMLVIAFALVLLRVGSPRMPVAESALLALVGLGLAGVLGYVCPDPRILMWWMDTPIGRAAESALGFQASTLCMGLCLALIAGAGAAVLLAVRRGSDPGIHLPALLLFVMIWPAVVVQSIDEPLVTFASWTLGLAIGAWLGVAAGAVARRAIQRMRPTPS